MPAYMRYSTLLPSLPPSLPPRQERSREEQHTFKASLMQMREIYAAVKAVIIKPKTHKLIGNTVFTAMSCRDVSTELMGKLTGILKSANKGKDYGDINKMDDLDFKMCWNKYDMTEKLYKELHILPSKTFKDKEAFEWDRKILLRRAKNQYFVLWGHAINNPHDITCACLLRVHQGEYESGLPVEALMQNVCANPQGEGIGSKLIDYVKTFCADHDISKLKCTVIEDVFDTDRLLGFYMGQHGFVFDIETESLSETGDVALIYQK